MALVKVPDAYLYRYQCMKQFLSWSLKFVPRSTENLPWIGMIRTGEVTSIHGPVAPINLRCVASVPRHPKQEVNATQMQVEQTQ